MTVAVVANFVPPLHAIVAPILPVLDPVGTISSQRTITDTGTVANARAVTDTGTITDTGTVTNAGTVTNTGTVANTRTVANAWAVTDAWTSARGGQCAWAGTLAAQEVGSRTTGCASEITRPVSRLCTGPRRPAPGFDVQEILQLACGRS